MVGIRNPIKRPNTIHRAITTHKNPQIRNSEIRSYSNTLPLNLLISLVASLQVLEISSCVIPNSLKAALSYFSSLILY